MHTRTLSQTHRALQKIHLILHNNWPKHNCVQAIVWVSHERFSLSASAWGERVSGDVCGLAQKKGFISFQWILNLISPFILHHHAKINFLGRLLEVLENKV